MNKFIIVLPLAAILLAGCNSNEERGDLTEPIKDGEITGLETHITLPRNGGASYKLIFETPDSWTISEYHPTGSSMLFAPEPRVRKPTDAAYSWCAISPMNGRDGASEAMVRLDENSGSPRRAKFVLSSGDQSVIFTVEQTDCDKSDMPEYDDCYETTPGDDNAPDNDSPDNDSPDNDDTSDDNDTPVDNTPPKEHIAFIDSIFGRLALLHYDTDGDGGISPDEIEHVEELAPEFSCVSAASLADVAKFKSLKVFRYDGATVESIDLSANKRMEHVMVSGIGLRRLNLAGCDRLSGLFCDGATSLEELVLPGNAHNLSDLQLKGVALTCLNVTNAPMLSDLGSIKSVKSLKRISLRGLGRMCELDLAGMSLDEVEVSDMESLRSLTLSKNASLSSIKISSTPSLTHLLFAHCNVGSIDLSGVTTLEEVVCSYNPLRSLDVSTNRQLKSVSAYGVSQMNGRDRFTVWKSYDADTDPHISADGNWELRAK